MKPRPFLPGIAVAVFVLNTAPAQAQSVPPLVNYQGRLSNPDGSPLPTADYQLTFNIYDATNGGNLIWGPQIFDGQAAQGHGSKIPVVQGYFNVMLGPVDTNGNSLANAFNATNRFVEITVTNHQPITPRQQILTAPFAFQAGNSAKLAGADWSAVFGTNDPVNGKIPGTKLADGAVTLAKLAPRQTLTNWVGVGGVAITGDSGQQTFTDTPFTDVTNLSVTITTTGRPVFISLIGSTNGLAIGTDLEAGGTTGAAYGYVAFLRGTDLIENHIIGMSAEGAPNPRLKLPVSSFHTIDVPPSPGTWTYKVQCMVPSPSYYINFRWVRLMAYEL